MSQVVVGLFFLVLGGSLLLPGAGESFRRTRDWQFRVMPWLRHMPGSKMWSDDAIFDRMVRLMRIVVGSLFVVFGVLAVVGVIDLK